MTINIMSREQMAEHFQGVTLTRDGRIGDTPSLFKTPFGVMGIKDFRLFYSGDFQFRIGDEYSRDPVEAYVHNGFPKTVLTFEGEVSVP